MELYLASACRYLANGRVPIIFIDTFHLFPETHAFLHRLEVLSWHDLAVGGLS